MAEDSNSLFNKEIKIAGKFEINEEMRKVCDKFFSSSHYTKDFKEDELIAVFSKETGFLFLINPIFVLLKFSKFDDLNIFKFLFSNQLFRNKPEILYLTISDEIKFSRDSDEVLRNKYYKELDKSIFNDNGIVEINYSNFFEGIEVNLSTRSINNKKEVSYNFTFDFDNTNKDVLFDVVKRIGDFYISNKPKILKLISQDKF